MLRLFAAIVLSVFAASVHSQTTLPYVFTKDREIRASPLQADLNVLLGAINGLSSRISKLEGDITAADLVGNYRFDGFQTELGTNHVSSYTYHGTATLTATSAVGGDLTLLSPEKGTQLNLIAPRTTSLIDNPAAPYTTTWSYSSGVLTVDGNSGGLAVVAGGRLLVGVSANPLDGTQVLLLLTRTD